jgi:hypothetical protein
VAFGLYVSARCYNLKTRSIIDVIPPPVDESQNGGEQDTAKRLERLEAMSFDMAAEISTRVRTVSTWIHAMATLVVIMDVLATGGISTRSRVSCAMALALFVPTLNMLMFVSGGGETKISRAACWWGALWALFSASLQIFAGIAMPIIGLVRVVSSMGTADGGGGVMNMIREMIGESTEGDSMSLSSMDGHHRWRRLIPYVDYMCGMESTETVFGSKISDCALLSIKTYIAIIGSIIICFVSAIFLFRRAIGTNARPKRDQSWSCDGCWYFWR